MSRLSEARAKLRHARRERHDARPKSDRRKKLGRLVRFFKDRIKRLLTRRQPDWNGHTPVLGGIGEKVVRKANQLGLIVTATTDGQHSSTSYHYQARAIDFGVNWASGVTAAEARAREVELQRWLARAYPAAREIFGPDSWYLKNGSRVGSAFPGHGDHTHFAY